MSARAPASAGAPSSVLAVVRDATCPRCSCVCDDIDLTVADQRIVAAERACPLGAAWFLAPPPVDLPACRIAGQPASVAAGIERAAQILAAARAPLVYGLTHTTCEAQRVAARLADWIGATLDTPTSVRQGPIGMAFQGVGEVTCSLGEMANRGDLIIVWGADPAVSHPRHFSKYSLEPQGMFVPRGRADRTCVVVDIRETASSAAADLLVKIRPGGDFEALWTLRAIAQGLRLDGDQVLRQTGQPLAVWQDLMQRMKQARFGVILYGPGLTQSRGRHLNTEALLALVRDLNAYTRFVARAFGEPGNGAGADNVLCWQTGYPFAINLARGYPRFSPGEYDSPRVLARGEADAALIVAADPLAEGSLAGDLQTADASAGNSPGGDSAGEHPHAGWSSEARAALRGIPSIVLASHETATSRAATVLFGTAAYGIEVPGTIYRMDDVPLPLRPALSSQLASDETILLAIEQRVRQLQAALSTPSGSER